MTPGARNFNPDIIIMMQKEAMTMNKKIKVALIGAGSAQFASHIVTDMSLCEGLRGSRVVLMDINEKRLEFITQVAKRLAEELKSGLEISKTTVLEEALEGADFVINSVQVGGYSWVEEQRSMAEKYGLYRGANLHEFGQMDYFLKLMRKMEEICPDAWHIQAANPVFEGGTYIARNSKIKTIGLCHGFSGYLQVADVLGLEREKVRANCYGFNHWLWMNEFTYDGRDAYPILDEWIETKAKDYWDLDNRPYHYNQMSRGAIHQYQIFGKMPIGDTPRHGGWWYHTSLAENQRWYGKIGGFDSEIGWKMHLENCANILSQIEKAAADWETPIVKALDAKQSPEQIIPVIHAIANDEPGIFQVNVPNQKQLLPDFPENLVAEGQARVDASGVTFLEAPPLPQNIITNAMMPRWLYAERKLEVLRSRSREALLLYLLGDHRMKDLSTAEALADEWLAHEKTKGLGIQ